MRKKQPITEKKKTIESEENLEDLNKLLQVKCKRCRKTISLANCDFDEDENPICRIYSGGCRG